MGQMRVRRTGPWVKISCPFSWVQFISACGSRCGSAFDPHFDSHHFRHFCNKKASKTEVFDAFWSCWADSNCRPHPYQKAFSLFIVCPFMLGNIPESLVLQGIRDFLFPIDVIEFFPVLGCFNPSVGKFVGTCYNSQRFHIFIPRKRPLWSKRFLVL